MNKLLLYYSYFLIYSIIGWIIEVTLNFINNKNFLNRGFLLGPYCPIYGIGAITISLIINNFDNIFTIFILSTISCSIIEYLTSYIMEKCFKANWWTYYNEKCNLNGRICLKNSLLFGIGGILTYYINPYLNNIILKLPYLVRNTIIIISLIIIIIDLITSLIFIVRFSRKNKININKDSTRQITAAKIETLNTIINS